MRRILISLTIVALLFVPQFASGDDLSDFKAFCAKAVNAWNAHDAETIVSLDYPGAITFATDNPFPSILKKEDRLTELKTIMASIDILNISLYNDQYKVVGDTGVSWGYYTITVKPKGQPMQSYYARYTLTAVKSGGKWQGLAMHESVIPTGN